MRHTALLIGDSQSEPADGWPRLGLASVGYKVHFCGLGGTGYVAANGKTGNYLMRSSGVTGSCPTGHLR